MPLHHAAVRMPLLRMQEGGPGFQGGGINEGVSGGQYQAPGMNTAPKGEKESLRPDKIDLEAAAASQVGIKEGAPVAPPPVPFVTTIFVGSGKLAGDVGFDPLLLAENSQTLAWYREAEIKHARLAMLAALGWPVAEKLDGPLAAQFGMDSLLTKDGLAPSILNGGLGGVSTIFWAFALGIGAFAENSYIDQQLGSVKTTTYVPGMLGLDPLGLDGDATRNGEIWLGRVAMVAVAVYALEEVLTKAPVL